MIIPFRVSFDLIWFIVIPRNPYTGGIHGYRNSQRVRTWLNEAKSVIIQTVQSDSKIQAK